MAKKKSKKKSSKGSSSSDIVVQAPELIRFLSLVKCNNSVVDCVLEGAKGYIKSYGSSINQEIVFDIKLKCTVNKSDITIPVTDIDRFISILRRFDSSVGLQYSEDFLKIVGKGKRASLRLSSEEAIDSKLLSEGKTIKGDKLVVKSKSGTNSYDFGVAPMEMEEKELDSLQKDSDVLGNKSFEFLTKGSKLLCIVQSDEDSFTQTLPVDSVPEGVRSKYGQGLSDVISALDSSGTVVTKISSGVGMSLSGSSGNISFLYLICEAE